MEENVKVNKLILIGNGLDLALGLKTSYNDFMFWLLKKYLLKSLENYGRQSAPEDYVTYNEFHRRPLRDIVFGYARNNLFDVIIRKNYNKNEISEKFESFNSLKDIFEFIKLDHIKIEINIKNRSCLFQKIYNEANLGWVDIESIYFQLIKELVNSNSKNKKQIESYNEDLKNIIIELNEYLKQLKVDVTKNDAEKYFKHFASPVKVQDIIEKEDLTIDNKKSHLYFLNFNYTESLQQILIGCDLDVKDYTINHIHGSFHEENPIIFGFGDEMDESYKKMEELNDNRFFDYIKSFKYFSNNNYRNLLRFLNSGYYQVCIYGHSCGLSDRVMLNEIFEHKNCKSINIYFYEDETGWNDFNTKTMDISRHFSSNKLMREKIVEFNPINKIPQLQKTI